MGKWKTGKTRFATVMLIFGVSCLFGGSLLVARPAYRNLSRLCLQQMARFNWVRRDLASTMENGQAVAWIKSDSAGLDSAVLLDGSPQNLLKFPCLSRSGVLPGEAGTVIIQAHRDTHFRGLGKLVSGDPVQLETVAGVVRRYVVSETEIMTRQQLETRFQQNFEGLVLVTCYPFRYTGPAPKRYLVWLREET